MIGGVFTVLAAGLRLHAAGFTQDGHKAVSQMH
jgi:hypothetical protein